MDTHDRQELLAARYGSQEKPDSVCWNEHVEHLLAHKSVRAFSSAPLPEGAIETMVAAAQSASTSSNLHQWSVVAELKSQVRHFARSETTGTSFEFIDEAPAVLLWVADTSRTHQISNDNGGSAEVIDYLDAFLMASIDTALAAQNAVVAAESMGLGTSFLGATRNHGAEIAELFEFPKYSFLAFGLAVGYPDPDRSSAIRPRPAQRVVLHHNKYVQTDTADWVADYEQSFRAFREANQDEAQGVGRHRHVRNEQGIHGRA